MAKVKTVLKIGLVIDTDLDQPDGVQQYTLAIGQYLAKAGHQVRYLAGDTKRTDLAGLYSLSRNMVLNSNGNRMSIPFLASRRGIRQVIKEERFDILHVQAPYHPFMAGQVINLAPARTVIVGTFHVMPKNRMLFYANYLLGLICYRSLRRFDQMFTVSEAAKDFCHRTFRLESIVLPNTIDLSRFKKAKPLPKYQDGKINILFFGRLVPRKGAMTLLKAVSRLPDDAKRKVRVLICGSGSEQADLRDYALKANIASLVEFCGFIDETIKPRYYASADISVFPSSGGESFGIVLLEAMASGSSAVLGGDNPGYRSVLKSRPELLFNSKHPQELADKLELYIGSRSFRQASASWGEDFCQQYDISIVGPRLVKHYRSLLAKKGSN